MHNLACATVASATDYTREGSKRRAGLMSAHVRQIAVPTEFIAAVRAAEAARAAAAAAAAAPAGGGSNIIMRAREAGARKLSMRRRQRRRPGGRGSGAREGRERLAHGAQSWRLAAAA